jgi:hypothetical protein
MLSLPGEGRIVFSSLCESRDGVCRMIAKIVKDLRPLFPSPCIVGGEGRSEVELGV